MKDEIMSKAEVSAFTSIFLGLAGYSIFIFYLLAKRSKGINYFDDLSSLNDNVLYLICFLIFIFSKVFKENKYIVNFTPLLIGILLSVMFFIVVL
ncbi:MULTISPECIES: hypothetical protein [Acinetobacter]|uniref:Uncharacterized protein n=17 Tax=Acinetobacter baumannii TaxID=470 RepID=A0A0D5YLR8_ACIBA|nr:MULTISPECIES: hypothetical protein [Acinetobacter]ACJ40585.1 hypothetical protein AB57_0786 [Acinetobacter baumannii AB0057]AJF80671.1 hypothetical protein ABA1_00762 [Acinetobacter baumannii]AKA32899.1 hypothetical protein ABUW_3192 [Acinetobacter baumannii]ALJ89127.1 hypothetical protein AN415_03233 [Acinetobacter baumannii]ARG30724.1 hypothetical protein B7L41_05665 [Acinetobacter baumannii]